MTDRHRMAVLGSPIAHSKSPELHRAAHRVLGLPWTYEAMEVATGELREFLDTRDESWRGLSLTMPLKREVLALLDTRDEITEMVGAANTVLLQDGRRHGFNTDVLGVTAAIAEAGIVSVQYAVILGAGASASSVLAALAGLGAKQVTVVTRSPDKGAALLELAHRLHVAIVIGGFGAPPADPDGDPDLVVSTLPGDAGLVQEFSAAFRARTPLIDIAYDPWPTALAAHWEQAGGRAHSGLAMLIHQALVQLRIFVAGDPHLRLDNEDLVLSAMRSAVGATTSPS